jgi:hypothetical protein
MKFYILLPILFTVIILVTNYDPIYAAHGGPHHDEQMGKQGMMGQQMMGNMR